MKLTKAQSGAIDLLGRGYAIHAERNTNGSYRSICDYTPCMKISTMLRLEKLGLVTFKQSAMGYYRKYRLTHAGQKIADKLQAEFPAPSCTDEVSSGVE